MPNIEELRSQAEDVFRQVGVVPAISETYGGGSTVGYTSPQFLVAGRVPGVAAVFSVTADEAYEHPKFGVTCEADWDRWNNAKHGDRHAYKFLPLLARTAVSSESGFGSPPVFYVNHYPRNKEFKEGVSFYATFLSIYADAMRLDFSETPDLIELVPHGSREFEESGGDWKRFEAEFARRLGI